jgi:hypothetical protein
MDEERIDRVEVLIALSLVKTYGGSEKETPRVDSRSLLGTSPKSSFDHSCVATPVPFDLYWHPPENSSFWQISSTAMIF